MNIVEAYIKFKNQLVIFVSGMSGTGISVLGANIARDFKLALLDMKEFCKKDYDVKKKLPNEKEVVNWDSDEVYDWNKAEDEIKSRMTKNKLKGIIVVGTALPKDKFKIEVDFHIHVKLAKQNILKRREKYVDLHKNEQCSDMKDDPSITGLIFNAFTFPYYLDVTQRSVINKYINANEYVELDDEKYNDKVYDDAFNYLVFQITKYLDSVPPSKTTTETETSTETEKESKNNKEKESDKSDYEISESLSEDINLSSTDDEELQERYIIRPDGKSYDVKDDFLL